MENKIITSKDNKLIKLTSKLFYDRKYHHQTNLFVCENKRVIETFIKNKFKIFKILVKSGLNFNTIDQKNIVYIDHKIYSYLSQMSNGDGCIGIFYKKSHDNTHSFKDNIIILDKIQNPNNLGSILRSADAFNIKNIILCNNSVDIYNNKVIQSSMGNGFNLNIFYVTDLSHFIKALRKDGYLIYATANNKQSVDINSINFNKKTAIIFGNEGKGLSNETITMCDKTLSIKINKNVNSLNLAIAASIMMYKLNNENN